MFEHLVEESTALVCGSMASRSWYTCEKLQARATVVCCLRIAMYHYSACQLHQG